MIQKNQTYLALDPGTHMGFALWQPGMPNPVSGIWKFEWGRDGDRYIGLQKKIDRQRIDFNGLKAIRMEFNKGGQLGLRALDLGYGWKHAAEIYAAAHKIPFGTVTTDGGWRIDFIGRQENSIIKKAGAAMKALHGKSDTRDKLKLAVIGRCHQLGWNPANTDEADALGLLDSWLLELRIDRPWAQNEVLRAPLGVR